MIQFGSDKIKEIYVGSDKIKEVYHGSDLVWSGSSDKLIYKSYEKNDGFVLGRIDSFKGWFDAINLDNIAEYIYVSIGYNGGDAAPTSAIRTAELYSIRDFNAIKIKIKQANVINQAYAQYYFVFVALSTQANPLYYREMMHLVIEHDQAHIPSDFIVNFNQFPSLNKNLDYYIHVGVSTYVGQTDFNLYELSLLK